MRKNCFFFLIFGTLVVVLLSAPSLKTTSPALITVVNDAMVVEVEASLKPLSASKQVHRLHMAFLPAILPTSGSITSGFGWRHHPILGVTKMHQGIDLAVPTGTPVVAPSSGTVTAVSRSRGYGKYVELRHGPTGYTSLFAHLSSMPDHIRPGRVVQRGDLIGFSGATGLVTGPHLHYEIRDKRGQAIPPAYVFKQYKRLREELHAALSSSAQ